MFNYQTENGTKLYEDENIEIKVGVDPLIDGVKINYHRELSNCIKIKANLPDAHFIQFVTRQSPNLFLYNESNKTKLEWMFDVSLPHYMEDSINPKWKLDVTKDFVTCFYEEKGLSLKEKDFISMYDYPGGDYEPEEERSTFCTFVIINNQITNLIRWSKQYIEHEKNEIECYCVLGDKWNKSLPYWAINIIKEFYNSKNKALPEFISKESLEILTKMQNNELLEESRSFFLNPPENWITLLKFPELFLEKSLIEKKEIQKEEKKIDISSELEKMALLEDEFIVSKETESKPLITQFEKTTLKKEEELPQEENEQVEDLEPKGTTKLFKK